LGSSKPDASQGRPSAREIGERIRKTLTNLQNALAADVQQARILVAELYGKIDVVAEGEIYTLNTTMPLRSCY